MTHDNEMPGEITVYKCKFEDSYINSFVEPLSPDRLSAKARYIRADKVVDLDVMINRIREKVWLDALDKHQIKEIFKDELSQHYNVTEK